MLRCINCNLGLIDDIIGNLDMDCSTNLKHLAELQPPVVLEIKCKRCKMFHTIFFNTNAGSDEDAKL